MQLSLDLDDFTGDVQCVHDPRGGWGIAFPIKQSTGNGPGLEATEVWGTLTIFGDVRPLLRKGAMALDFAMGEPEGLRAVKSVLEALPAGSLGMVSSPVPPYKEDLIPAAIRGIATTIAQAAKNKGA